MSYYFFFSYSRANDDAFLQQFFEDLSQAIRELEGFGPKEVVGFFDQRELKLGAEWDNRLVDALQTCPALVCVYSPAYFKSENCGREWQVFEDRRKLFRDNERAAGNPGAGLPEVIKPVIWIPVPDGLPASVGGAQYTVGQPSAVHNTEGLKKMRKQYPNYSAQYDDFVADLAKQIRDVNRNINLPPLDVTPEYESVTPAFPKIEQTPARGLASQQNARTKGPKFVQFVFVAGSPEQFPRSLSRQPDYYIPQGGRQWKPFLPRTTRPILPFVQHIASEEGLDFSSQELPFNSQLPAAIRDAERERSLVIVFVDSWSIDIADYKRVLEAVDQQIYFNCSIIVPWNDDDNQTVQQQNRLRDNVRATFRRWSLLHAERSIFFCDSIHSSEQLSAKLREILAQLHNEVINSVMNNPDSVIPRRVESNIAKPTISNKLAPGGG
jgi:FxsC-like protein